MDGIVRTHAEELVASLGVLGEDVGAALDVGQLLPQRHAADVLGPLGAVGDRVRL